MGALPGMWIEVDRKRKGRPMCRPEDGPPLTFVRGRLHTRTTRKRQKINHWACAQLPVGLASGQERICHAEHMNPIREALISRLFLNTEH